MGIDSHGLNLLRYARLSGEFGHTVMIGRQNVHESALNTQLSKRRPSQLPYGPFAEELLMEEFGASKIDSVDYSDFEGATILHDMNKPLSTDLRSSFQTVMDYGTLEHVFDVAQALKNVNALCDKDGGRILHVLPANNQCGHGFWQFSPELFFSLYSEENGFKNTEIFIASLINEKVWFRAIKPPAGQRLNIVSKERLYVLVLTTKTANSKNLVVQQSDYVAAWDLVHMKPADVPRSIIAKGRQAIRRWYKKYVLQGITLSQRFGKNHRYLQRVIIADILGLP